MSTNINIENVTVNYGLQEYVQPKMLEVVPESILIALANSVTNETIDIASKELMAVQSAIDDEYSYAVYLEMYVEAYYMNIEFNTHINNEVKDAELLIYLSDTEKLRGILESI